MKAGPKGQIDAIALDFTGWPRDRAKRREKFIREYLVVPKGFGAGKPVRLRDFQRDIIRRSFASGVRTSLVSIPRANGKTALAAMLAVAELFVGDPSAEVLVVASDQRQANITLRMAKRMIELNPELADRAHIYADRITVPENDSILLPLPAEPGALHGHDPSLLIIDELHVVTESVWEAVTSMTGKRPQSLTLAISTPANSTESVMWRLVAYGRGNRDDRAFVLTEYSAPDDCQTTDRDAWRVANPALSCRDPFLAEDGLEAARRTLREPVFRQLRLGQWVGQVDRWLPWGLWESRQDAGRIVHPGEKVWLAFDGSASGDSTALIGCTTDGHLFVVGLWERAEDDPRWRVPREEVDDAVTAAFTTYDVAELAADPWGWRSELESWSRRWRRKVIEWNTGAAARMAPATDRMYQALVDGTVTHDGDQRLADHFGNAVAKSTPMGDLIYKDKRGSARKIDAAIASIIAFDRRAFHLAKQRGGGGRTMRPGARVAASW
ncbi:terminase large subunit domain-containing protein [Smaragdicoccus niigatensis]|uniref:terminase large subunit domain-containing protein n=1 Tax=Smaragdicoccus niigatensis TaxID=359359 RepID=UPI00036316C9|nr:terminase large subunit [Smaragdicoccus niigatensis]